MLYKLLLAYLLPCILGEQLLTLQGQDLSRGISECEKANVHSCEKVLVNYDALLTASTLELPLGLSMTVSRSANSRSLSSMAFTLDNKDEGAQGVFVYNEVNNKKYISGTLNWANQGRHFKLEKCSNDEDCYTWSEVNTDFWVDESEPIHVEQREAVSKEFEDLLERGRQDSTTPVTVTVTIYTTDKFRESFVSPDDMRGFIDLAIAETNQGYANSRVPIKMMLHCIVNAPIKEEESSQRLLKNFMKASGGKLSKFRKSADVAVILSMFEDNCGIAFTNVLSNGQTLGAVGRNCATGYYSFAHEIAHMAGCLHNRENSPRNPYFPNAFGYLLRPPVESGYRSILAYNAEGYQTRVNHYSNPDVTYNDIPTGTPKDNNAFALITRRFAMAAVGDESIKCQL